LPEPPVVDLFLRLLQRESPPLPQTDIDRWSALIERGGEDVRQYRPD
jgi:hypothetical protein